MFVGLMTRKTAAPLGVSRCTALAIPALGSLGRESGRPAIAAQRPTGLSRRGPRSTADSGSTLIITIAVHAKAATVAIRTGHERTSDARLSAISVSVTTNGAIT